MERAAAGAPAGTQFVCALTKGARAAEPSRFSSSDSDFDDEEPRKFYVHIKPAPARPATCSSEAAAAQLRATAGSLILPPGPGVSGGPVGGASLLGCAWLLGFYGRGGASGGRGYRGRGFWVGKDSAIGRALGHRCCCGRGFFVGGASGWAGQSFLAGRASGRGLWGGAIDGRSF